MARRLFLTEGTRAEGVFIPHSLRLNPSVNLLYIKAHIGCLAPVVIIKY